MPLCLCGSISFWLRNDNTCTVTHGSYSDGYGEGERDGDLNAHAAADGHDNPHSGASDRDQHAIYDANGHP